MLKIWVRRKSQQRRLRSRGREEGGQCNLGSRSEGPVVPSVVARKVR